MGERFLADDSNNIAGVNLGRSGVIIDGYLYEIYIGEEIAQFWLRTWNQTIFWVFGQENSGVQPLLL